MRAVNPHIFSPFSSGIEQSFPVIFKLQHIHGFYVASVEKRLAICKLSWHLKTIQTTITGADQPRY